MKVIGWQVKEDSGKEKLQIISPRLEDDGAVLVSGSQNYSGFSDVDTSIKDEAELITKYRSMAKDSDIDLAIDDIINEAITIDEEEDIVTIVCENLPFSDNIKTKIKNEYDNILEMLNFSNYAYDIFRNFYVDGRLRYHVVIDEAKPRDGIQELRYLDPRTIRKIKETEAKKISEALPQYQYKDIKNEYYIYNERGFQRNTKNRLSTDFSGGANNIPIAKDSIIDVSSGILSEDNSLVLSHLHNAMKPLNQLRNLEDASVIYRLTRAPERRIFYIDIGNLPKMKGEQYMRQMMAMHKNKLAYDPATGDVRNERKFMTMTEDYWFPRREGSRGTEVDTLQGGQNLGEMEEVLYFQKKLFKSLHVPISRMEPDAVFSMGRASEITRDEVKFAKFVGRLRTRFSMLFTKALEKQLLLKNILSPENLQDFRSNIRYDYQFDNHFNELKEIEIEQNRINAARDADEFVGKFVSAKWVRSKLLRQTEDDIKDIDKEIKEEKNNPQYQDLGGEEGFDGGGPPERENNPPPKPEETPKPSNDDQEKDAAA